MPSESTRPRRAACALRPADPDWQRALPRRWRALVLAPCRFATYRADDMPALRCLGYGADDAPCYYHHTFALDTLCVDDDDEFYETFLYGEDVHAWRLADGRWLVWRAVRRAGDCRGGEGVLSVADAMPR